MNLLFEDAAIFAPAGLALGATAKAAKSLNSELDSSVWGQGAVSSSEQQLASRSADGALL